MKISFGILSVILLLASCTGKTSTAANATGEPINEIAQPVLEDNNGKITAEKSTPLLIGGKQYRGYLGDRVEIMYYGLPALGFSGDPVYCTIEDIDKLFIVGFRIDPENPEYMSNLENLELLQNIKELMIMGQNMDSVDFSSLALLPNLESISIYGNISKLPDLTALNKLKRIIIQDSALESLDGLGAPALEELDINMETFETLAPLSNLTELKGLEIIARRNRGIARMDLSNVPRLEFLTIMMTDGVMDVTGIERLTGLAHLRFGTTTDLVNPQGISGLQNLATLSMTLTGENPSVEYLRGLQKLDMLYIEGTFWRNIGEELYQVLDVSPLSSNHNLQLLRMRHFIIKNISSLDNLKNLKHPATGVAGIDLVGSRLFEENEKSVHDLLFNMSH